MLLCSVVVIAWAATSFATPPPGYVKEPDNDKDPPAYEYKYDIGDGNGRGQGKAETRSGEFASGSYYVNTGQATTDVKYFADDWGYHPVVKYGSTNKHSTATTRFALGEHAVKALRNGDDDIPKVKLPIGSKKRRPVQQIIQPYSIEDNDPAVGSPTYPTISNDAGEDSNVAKVIQDPGDSKKSVAPNLPNESRNPSTVLIPSPSHSTTPAEIVATPTPLAYAPLQEVRDIYARNDYRNAALIDEQLFLHSSAGNFGQKVHATSLGESGIKDPRHRTLTTAPAFSLTKQNGDVTYTVHSGTNSNTAYLSSGSKNKKVSRPQHHRYQNRQKFAPSSTTESYPNYSSSSSTHRTTSGEFTSNDLVSENQAKYEYASLGAGPSQEFHEFGATDPRLVNYGLASVNDGPTDHQVKPGNDVPASSTVSPGVFAEPIVVAEVTPTYDRSEYSTTYECMDDLVGATTPSTVSYSTTLRPVVSTNTILVTPESHGQSHITTSSVILNPIQAGVALVNAGETHLISDVATKSSGMSEESSETVGNSKEAFVNSSQGKKRLNLEERIRELQKQQEEHELREENRVHREKQMQQLQEEIKLREVQQLQELQLQRNQYQIQELQLGRQIQLQELQQQRYQYDRLNEDLRLRQDVELQQVEESRQDEHLGQNVVKEGLDQRKLEEVHVEETHQPEEINLQVHRDDKVQEQARELLQHIGNYHVQQEQRQATSASGQDDQNIEIQRSIEIYHSAPVQEIHYPSQVAGAQIDQSQGRQRYIELQNIENTQPAYQVQVQSPAQSTFEINHTSELGHQLPLKDLNSLVAENQAQQVFQAEHQSDLNQAYDLTRSNSLSQQSSTNNGVVLLGFRVNHDSGEQNDYQLGNGLEIDQQQRATYQRDQSNSYSNSYESGGHGQQQVVLRTPPYTIEASRELVLPRVQSTVSQIIETPPVFQNHVAPNSGSYGVEALKESGTEQRPPAPLEKVIEKTVHVPQPYPVEKIIEKQVAFPVEVEKVIEKQVPIHVPRPYPVEVEKIIEKTVPYPVDRIVEKHIPVLHPYPVHIKVPQPYPVEKIIEKPYPVETIVEKPIHIHVPVEKIVEKTVHVPQPYPVEKIVERIVEKHVRVPYAVELIRNVPYGVQYGVSYQQIMRPHSQNLYSNHGKARTTLYGLPVVNRHQESFRQHENSHGYSYEKPSVSFVDGGDGAGDQSSSGSQPIVFKHSLHHQNLGSKSNSHAIYPHYSSRRLAVRQNSKDKGRAEEYVGPVPPQIRLTSVRHHQHSLQNQHAVQVRSPQSSTATTRSPTSATTLRRAREPESKPPPSTGNFRQSRVEYGFKPPMIPSVQYDEKTASKVES